jgi:large subunit ribosomal protein L4
MKRAALLSALTDTLSSGKLALLEGFDFEEPRTKDAVQLIQDLELTGRILVVLHEPTDVVEKSFNNLPYVKVSYARSLNVYELLAADRVLFTAAAMDVLEGKDPEASTAGGSAPERSGGAGAKRPPAGGDSGATPASSSDEADEEDSSDDEEDQS